MTITVISENELALQKEVAELRAELATAYEGWRCECSSEQAYGFRVVPDWKGYALLGTGNYVITHSATFDERLGAELIITLATDADKAGNRQVGESRMNPDDAPPIESDEMVIRIGFLRQRRKQNDISHVYDKRRDAAASRCASYAGLSRRD